MAHRQPAARSSLLPTLDSLGKAAGAEGGQGGPGAAGGAGPAGPGGFHSSDVDVTEVTLKDMNPDDIRVRLVAHWAGLICKPGHGKGTLVCASITPTLPLSDPTQGTETT